MTAIDTALPSLTIVKSFDYRGAPEEWSNTYFMTGDTPSDSASWKVLADAVIAEEKLCFDPATEIVRAIGHEPGESVAVWGYDYENGSGAIAGTFSPAVGDITTPGDAAIWVRWSTDLRTSKGKPIYLRNYMHGAYARVVGSDRDLASPTQAAALLEYGQDWAAGFTDGDGTLHLRAGPHGVVGLVASASTYVTTRTLERRGKRP